MSMDEPLFNPVYISPEVQRALKEGFIVRPLAASDYEKGTVFITSGQRVSQRFSYLKSHNYEYFTIVIEDTKKKLIVGAGTIFVERKFVHGNGLVGHIEDIVTLSDYRGLNLGKLVIETLKYIGKHTGCYKIILDCSDKNIPFYQKCGFAHKEFEMVLYIDENDRAKAKL
ncbi:Glucosamine-phosphate N-acetyltransferase-like protein [Rhizophlyctis rosea]|nr:Glucosamine-phosphate N-acetyltransferase-like protein [Rhizophlyctis rosea]